MSFHCCDTLASLSSGKISNELIDPTISQSLGPVKLKQLEPWFFMGGPTRLRPYWYFYFFFNHITLIGSMHLLLWEQRLHTYPPTDFGGLPVPVQRLARSITWTEVLFQISFWPSCLYRPNSYNLTPDPMTLIISWCVTHHRIRAQVWPSGLILIYKAA